MFKILLINRYWFVLGLLLLCSTIDAQVRSGAAFLKMLPGARLQSMAGAHTAILDDPHAIFANPGTAGFLREWQWAASYTKWIADISNTSFIYGKAISTPWSRQSRFALGVQYQGVPEFNNNPAVLPPASASDFVASLSLGQPLTFFSDFISIGANLKYLSSSLAHYSARGFVYDFGLTARTTSFRLGKLAGALAFGAALNQNGKDLVFEQTGTPLPKTSRAGLAFYLGSHKGLNMVLSADYINVKDEKPYLAVGAEVMVNRILALNAGYDTGSDLFKKVSFGASIRLDHVGLSLGEAFPGRHNAFRLDFATLDDADFFSRTYRGSAAHFPTRPEFFQFVSPANDDSLMSPDVVLRWEKARDQDIYDKVTYHVLLDRDSSNIAYILSSYETNPELFMALLQSKLAFNGQTEHTFMPVDQLSCGDYYWAIAAIDQDEQVRFAEGPAGTIAHFVLPLPDVEIKDIEVEYNPYITMDDYHGRVTVTLHNNGEQPARNFKIRFVDEIDRLDYTLDALASASNDAILPDQPPSILEATIPHLAAGESQHVDFEWHSALLGIHKITAIADPDDHIVDVNRDNNLATKILHTVPKGVVSAFDSVNVLQTSTLLIDIPLITEITFDPNSFVVKEEYSQQKDLEPILKVIAERLQENPQMHIQLQGFADPNSDQATDSLANARAAAVTKTLIAFGVNEAQIDILPGSILPLKRMRSNEQDSEWLLEERRYVKITTNRENSHVLLRPLRHKDVQVEESDIRFTSDISSPAPLYQGSVHFSSDSAKDFCELVFTEDHKVPEVSWRPNLKTPQQWLNKKIQYYLSLTDSLGRQFRSATQELMLAEDAKVKRQILSVPLQFGKTDPLADFYWQELFEYAKETMVDSSIHLRFEGHACAIGSAEVNKRLSQARAQRFDREFKQFLRAKDESFSESIIQRIEAPVGLGESEPLSMQLTNGATVIGDNSTSLGRKLNRRIELVFYKNGIKH
ncbi:PorV/PorQ family protein [candidate division KSB1 bacterium]|nr:PorV/PorQ family protein [candidate division KSB1 bacterium]RQW00608.1 MAG: PorV/PorQ family protein [candidate division KSB1 bacterium]